MRQDVHGLIDGSDRLADGAEREVALDLRHLADLTEAPARRQAGVVEQALMPGAHLKRPLGGERCQYLSLAPCRRKRLFDVDVRTGFQHGPSEHCMRVRRRDDVHHVGADPCEHRVEVAKNRGTLGQIWRQLSLVRVGIAHSHEPGAGASAQCVDMVQTHLPGADDRHAQRSDRRVLHLLCHQRFLRLVKERMCQAQPSEPRWPRRSGAAIRVAAEAPRRSAPAAVSG